MQSKSGRFLLIKLYQVFLTDFHFLIADPGHRYFLGGNRAGPHFEWTKTGQAISMSEIEDPFGKNALTAYLTANEFLAARSHDFKRKYICRL